MNTMYAKRASGFSHLALRLGNFNGILHTRSLRLPFICSRTYATNRPSAYVIKNVFTKTFQTDRKFSDNPSQELPKRRKRISESSGPISWKSMFIGLGIGGVFLAGMQYFKHEKELERDKQRRQAIGKAAIGGTFDLIDHTGTPRKSEDYFGNWLLIYFGFTHCPDICPDEIEKMIEVVESMERKKYKILPLFITVDPDRDSVEAVAKYVKEFSPKLIGLTGPKENVHACTRAYRVYYSAGPKDVDEDYIVDHTIITYLVNPEGEFVDYYGQTKTVDEITGAICMQMLKYDKLNKKSWFKG